MYVAENQMAVHAKERDVLRAAKVVEKLDFFAYPLRLCRIGRPEVVFQPVCPKSADFRDAVQS